MERLTLQNLEQKITNEEKVVVLVLADWCGQCRMQKAIIEKHKDAFEGIIFTEIDAETEKIWDHSTYQIKSVPTFLFFKNGELTNTIEGYQYEKDFLTLLNQFKSE